MQTKIDIDMVKQLLDALENDQQDKASGLIDELTSLRESELYLQVNELTANLHQTLDELGDSSLLMQTKHDIPDATERLEYVMQTTQEASEKTLDMADKTLQNVAVLEERIESLDASTKSEITSQLEEVKQNLTEIILGQSFQDLTGQVLNRIILVIGSIEQSLIQLIENSKYEYHAIPDRDASEDNLDELLKGVGPNVTRRSKKDILGQDDVDSLLDDLGI